MGSSAASPQPSTLHLNLATRNINKTLDAIHNLSRESRRSTLARQKKSYQDSRVCHLSSLDFHTGPPGLQPTLRYKTTSNIPVHPLLPYDHVPNWTLKNKRQANKFSLHCTGKKKGRKKNGVGEGIRVPDGGPADPIRKCTRAGVRKEGLAYCRAALHSSSHSTRYSSSFITLSPFDFG